MRELEGPAQQAVRQRRREVDADCRVGHGHRHAQRRLRRIRAVDELESCNVSLGFAGRSDGAGPSCQSPKALRSAASSVIAVVASRDVDVRAPRAKVPVVEVAHGSDVVTFELALGAGRRMAERMVAVDELRERFARDASAGAERATARLRSKFASTRGSSDSGKRGLRSTSAT